MPEAPLEHVQVDPMIMRSESMLALIDILDLHGDPMAWRFPVALFIHLGQRPNKTGSLGRASNRRLAHICCWPGDPDAFGDALRTAEWIADGEDGEVFLVGWGKKSGKAVQAREDYRTQQKIKAFKKWGKDADGNPIDSPQNAESMPGDAESMPEASRDGASSDAGKCLKVRGKRLEVNSSSSTAVDEKLPDALGVRELIAAVESWAPRWSPVARPDSLEKARSAAPFGRDAVLDAKARAEADDATPNLGFLISILTRPSKSRRARSPPEDPRVGHHPGSKEFGDGPQSI